MWEPIKLQFKEEIVKVFAGPTFSFFKTRTEKIYACGYNDCGQLGIGKVLKVYKKKVQ